MVLGGEDAQPTLNTVGIVEPNLTYQCVGTRRPEIEVVEHIHVSVGVYQVGVQVSPQRVRKLSDLRG